MTGPKSTFSLLENLILIFFPIEQAVITDLVQCSDARLQGLGSQISVISNRSRNSFRKPQSIRSSFRRQFSTQASSLWDEFSHERMILPENGENGEIIIDEYYKDEQVFSESSGKMAQIETSEIGSVKWNVYTVYLKATGYFLTFLVFLFYAIANGFQVGANVWLADWSNSEGNMNKTPPDTGERLAGYAGLGLSQGFIFLTLSRKK